MKQNRTYIRSISTRGRYADGDTHKTATSRYTGERAILYAKGGAVAVSRAGSAAYLGTDMLGSVRSVTDSYGAGAFAGGVDFGYAGKPYDAVTGMYNYGFRDYAPTAARFTTLDPIRDGSNWFAYVNGDPVNYVDLWGLAPKNMSESDRKAYMSELSRYAKYDKDKDDMSLPNEYDCADVATYLYDKGMNRVGVTDALSDLNHAGNNVTKHSQMQSQDYFPGTGNISYYESDKFNNPYIEVGSVMVWQGPGIDPITGKGWIGHVATIVDVQREQNGDVSKISIIQGHTGGYKSEVVDIPNQEDLNTYIGTFLGFGEIGRDSLEKMPTNFQEELKNGIMNTVINSTTKNNCNK